MAASLTRLSTFNARIDSLLQGISESEISSADRDLATRQAVAEYNNDLPRERKIKFPGNGSSFYLMYGNVVDVDEAGLDAGIVLKSSGADSKLAILFTLDKEMEIYQVNLWLERLGATVAGTLSVSLYALNDSLPAYLIANSGNVEIDDEAEGAPLGRYDRVKFFFAHPYKLPAGNYAAVLSSASYTYSAGVTEVSMGVDQSSITNTVYTYDGASVWSAYVPDSAGIIEVVGGVPGWSAESGTIVCVEYPAADISANEEPQLLDSEDYDLFKTETGEYLRFLTMSPSSSENVRLTYNHPYAWGEAADPLVEIPPVHFEAICNLSAGIACEWLATKYGQSIASSILADSVDRRTKPDIYLSLANRFRKSYRQLAGLPEKESGATAGMAVVDVDFGPAVGRDFLFHGASTR